LSESGHAFTAEQKEKIIRRGLIIGNGPQHEE
jgi:hypothetical protein